MLPAQSYDAKDYLPHESGDDKHHHAKEEDIVPAADIVTDPLAVVVKLIAATIANAAVLCVIDHLGLAYAAEELCCFHQLLICFLSRVANLTFVPVVSNGGVCRIRHCHFIGGIDHGEVSYQVESEKDAQCHRSEVFPWLVLQILVQGGSRQHVACKDEGCSYPRKHLCD